MSKPFLDLNSFIQYSISLLSKSSPPVFDDPLTDFTSINKSSNAITDIFKNPAPKSKIRIFSSFLYFYKVPAFSELLHDVCHAHTFFLL